MGNTWYNLIIEREQMVGVLKETGDIKAKMLKPERKALNIRKVYFVTGITVEFLGGVLC